MTKITKKAKAKTIALKKISAVQAGTIVGLHIRYSTHLKKAYVGQLLDVKSWAIEFKEKGLIDQVPEFLA